MTEKLEKTIKEDLVKLPKEMQTAINSFGWDKITNEIGKKYFLSDDEINNLQLEVGLILLGYKTLNLLAPNIESSIGIDNKTSFKISEELDEKVFTPIEKIIQLSIKTGLVYKKTSWSQTVNFIVSGGNYFAFLDDNS